MKKITLTLALLLSIFLTMAQTKIYHFSIDEAIAKPAKEKVEMALKSAQETQAELILLHLNTFGGELEAADEIRTMLLKSEIPVYVFINVNAASAGALISIACDSIYMAPGASIGAASVVNQTGEVMPDKYQSYMRSLMRATAIANGRDADMAQAMVDPDIAIKGVIDSGKVLTFTTDEAIAHHFCEAKVENKEEILQRLNIEDYELIEQELTALEKLALLLMNPMISGLLIMVIIGGIYFELQTPGVGFPILAAAIAAVLYFAPFYLHGVAEYWEIILFVIGVILLIIEIFAIPGFGILGIPGIILIVTSLILVSVNNQGFDFSYTLSSDIIQRLFVVSVSIVLGFIGSILLAKKLISVKTPFGHIALNTEMDKTEGYISQDTALFNLVGKEGKTITILRPSGKISIDDHIFDAVAQTGFIENNETIKVIAFENSQFIVSKIS